MNLEKATVLVKGFENGTLPKQEWTHVAHFIIALSYCVRLPLPNAVHQIRTGIKKYNLSVGGQNTDSSGYHETVTLFYITLIADYLVRTGVADLTDETLAHFLRQPFIEKEYMYRYYSRELLMSKEARRDWTAPDKVSFPAHVLVGEGHR